MQTHDVIATTAAGGFRTDISDGRHTFVADEPTEAGGTDTGPTAYELLAAALAACTTITLTMYARRKGFALRAVSAQVTHDKVHATDCENCDKNSRIDEFRRTIHVDGELSDAERDRLLYIADRCPVHRTLHDEIRVVTTLAD